MKKRITVALALAAVISLSACGANGGTTETSTEAVQEQTTTASEAEAAEAEETTAAETTAEETTTEETEPAPEIVEATAEDFECEYDAVLGGTMITMYKGDATAIRIPAEINGDAVKKVEINFNDNLTYIEVPEGVIEVDFLNCGALETVILPESLTTISERAFAQNVKLSQINIPAGVTTIGDSAFSECESLTQIELPEGITEIAGHTFYQCESLTHIDIPESVTTIGHSAFSNSGITSCTVPGKIGVIPESMFYSCKSLESVEIQEGVTEICYDAFAYCDALTEVKIPNSLKTINLTAFEYCDKLREMILPDDIESLSRDKGDGMPFEGKALTITYRGEKYTHGDNYWQDLYDAVNAH